MSCIWGPWALSGSGQVLSALALAMSHQDLTPKGTEFRVVGQSQNSLSTRQPLISPVSCAQVAVITCMEELWALGLQVSEKGESPSSAQLRRG